MLYYVYILVSVNNPSHHYVGITTNLKERFAKHNSGGCFHTSKYKPWHLETAISFSNKEKAVKFENYLKSGAGREFARRYC